MKWELNLPVLPYRNVTLHVRVWIEMTVERWDLLVLRVTLHVRVWIEIQSLTEKAFVHLVTLHVRVWIEMSRKAWTKPPGKGHPPREGVD